MNCRIDAKGMDPVRRRTLALIADSAEGRTDAFLFSRGVIYELLAGLVRDGLAIAEIERAGRWRPVEMIRFRVTEAGRRALQCLSLRRIVRLDGYPDEYNVVHKGQPVARIHRMNGVAGETWCWARIGPPAPTHGTNGGMADSFDEAKAAFRAAWDAYG